MDAWQRAVGHVASRSTGGPLPTDARITLHFHPDRPVGASTVLERIAAERAYRSQFSSGISNGGLTAHPGGDRWRWESRMFGGAYDAAPDAERPVYGAVEHRGSAVGGAIRFGSSWLELARGAWDRVTLCWPDSVAEPERFGTTARAGALLALSDAAAVDPLDDYVEAHVHGGLRLPADVERVVLDPSFRGTAIERAAALLGVPVAWHAGLELWLGGGAARARRDELVAYRGPETLALAVEIAESGRLDARTLGAVADRCDPQALKRVWHLVARFGEPVIG